MVVTVGDDGRESLHVQDPVGLLYRMGGMPVGQRASEGLLTMLRWKLHIDVHDIRSP